jgi:hypothetical protein
VSKFEKSAANKHVPKDKATKAQKTARQTSEALRSIRSSLPVCAFKPF